MRYLLLFAFLVLATSEAAYAQPHAADSVVYADTLRVHEKSFDQDVLERLKEDSDFRYEIPTSVGETLWDRFWMWVAELLQSAIEGATGTNWGRVGIYLAGIAMLVVLIMLLLKVNAFRLITSAQGSSSGQEIHGEKIHEMDFEHLIQQAIAEREYRRGVRLLFLYSLKLLSDRQLVLLQSGKTNHDYVDELAQPELRSGFRELSFYFEYAWYGNFRVTEETFQKANLIFQHWRTRVR